MFARLLTFTGTKDILKALDFLREQSLPVLKGQSGFRGVSAACDRADNIMTILSLWDTETDLTASDAAMLATREDAMVRGNSTMQVEHFEQVSEAFAKTPTAGTALTLTRLRVAPDSVNETLLYLEREMLSRLLAQPGFCSMRTLFDRRSGRGLTGLSWENPEVMRVGEAVLRRHLAGATGHGLRFDDSLALEVLLFEMR